ncbi:MAG: electron transport complex subunit RsxC [Clostridia bacterium]|nr:electron transport complex subunit RsxC [Clostridia bacterium]
MKTFKGGKHVPDFKSLTAEAPIEQMLVVPDYYYSLSQHIGAPAQPVVQVGDVVKAGQLIAQAGGFVSANVYSSVAGEVVEICDRPNAQGTVSKCIHIHTAEKQEVETLPKMKEVNKQTILERIALAGIVGMGGAGFPTHVKLQPKDPVDTLIINAAECEPYLNCDNRLLIEKTEEVVKGAMLMAEGLGVNQIIFGIEDNKPQAIQCLQQHANQAIKVEVLKTKYPQGAEKQLIYACTKRVVACGALPASVGVVVQNVATAVAVYDAVYQNKALYSRIVTVTGDAVVTPKNLEVKIGTPVSAIIDYCNGTTDKVAKVISGGPMMGFALTDLSVATTKTDSGLLCLSKDSCDCSEPTACINCGRCVDVCPMKLEPVYIELYSNHGDLEGAKKYGALNCMECGACSYMCPAKRPLVQSIRLAKAKIRAEKAKENK